MPLDFPSNPVNGQTFSGFTFDGTAWYSNPGSLNGIPAGSIMAWPTSTAPSNWLICDGSAISRTTYASLFAAIGTTYGAGNGTTTFNIPDLRGRVPVGKDSGTFVNLGSTGGTETVTLTEAQIPSHSHANNLINATVASSTHTHGSSTMTAAVWVGYWKTRNGTSWTATNSGGVTAPGSNSTTTSSGASVEGSTDGPSATTTVGITNASTGGGGSHNNLQPYQVVNYIIKHSAAVTVGDSELATRVGAIETTTVRSVALGGTGASTASGALTNLGAAAASHTHDASTIVSGTLPISRGGTGVTTGSGLIPIIPTSVVIGSGTASTNTSTGRVTFSGGGGIILNGVFSNTYTNYVVKIEMTGTSQPNDYVYWRFAQNGVYTTVAAYYGGCAYNQGTTLSTFQSNQGTSYVSMGYAAASGGNAYTVNVFAPYNSLGGNRPTVTFHSSYENTSVWGTSKWNGGATFDGFWFYPAGNGTITGNVTVYGQQ